MIGIWLVDSPAGVVGSLKGLVDGVGRDVLDVISLTLSPFTVPTGDILEGRVPARARLVAGLPIPASLIGTRSGKPSCDGDSGTIDRGVDVPLTGGPQMLGESPACPCNSRVRFGYNLEPCSCNGDPAPDLVLLELDMPPLRGLGPLYGDVVALREWKSTVGDTLDRFKFGRPSGRVPGAMKRLASVQAVPYFVGSIR